MQQDWNIKSRSEVCGVTGRAFTEGEVFYTVLFQDGEVFRRTDLCEGAWNARLEDGGADPVFSYWRSKFEPPTSQPTETLPRDDAEGMLRRLIESNNPSYAKTRYVLAVMLERKKILRPQQSPDKGTLVYEHSSTGEVFIISDPALSLADLRTVQEEVSAQIADLTISAESPATGEAEGSGKSAEAA